MTCLQELIPESSQPHSIVGLWCNTYIYEMDSVKFDWTVAAPDMTSVGYQAGFLHIALIYVGL